jgi:hypothetical protein
MKTTLVGVKWQAVSVIAVLTSMAPAVLADGYSPERREGDEPFTLAVQRTGTNVSSVTVVLSSGTQVRLGELKCDPELKWQQESGIDTNTVQVHNLNASVPLLHIEWLDLMQGAGCYENCYYLIVPKHNPTKILARGAIPLHGRWGYGTGVGGTYQVTCVSNVLTIEEETCFSDRNPVPKPLYHEEVQENGESQKTFATCIVTKVCRTYAVHGKVSLRRMGTVLGYHVQKGDTLDDICEGLGVERRWIANPEDIGVAEATIRISIPAAEAEVRYPTVNNRDPWEYL